LPNLSGFLKFYTAGKRMQCATKFMRHYPYHPRHVATLPWEINNSFFVDIQQIFLYLFIQLISPHIERVKTISTK